MEHQPVANGPLTMSATPVAPGRPLGRAAPTPTAQRARAATFTLTRATALPYVWAVARLLMAWTFLWPFFDKMFGLNHQTTTAQAWINGGNPTKGFLSGSAGLLSGFYTSIAGATMLILMWSASLPPSDDLFLDNHIIHALLLIGLAAIGAGKTLGFGE